MIFPSLSHDCPMGYPQMPLGSSRNPHDHPIDSHPPPAGQEGDVKCMAAELIFYFQFLEARRVCAGGVKVLQLFSLMAYGSMIYPLSNLCRCSKIPVADDLAKKDPGGSLGNRLREYVILRILYISNKKYVFWFFKQIQE